MKLVDLLEVLSDKEIQGLPESVEISGIVYDPLRVLPGCVFVAIEVYTQLDKIEIPDGHDVVDDAIKRGAAVVVIERDVPVSDNVVKVLVPNSRYALALMANKFYDYPSHDIQMIGVTGTNGKTTTTHIVESIFMQKYRTGLIGTLYYKINGTIYQSKDTTPEPPDLQDIFTRMKQQDVDYCTMEVSSHGIEFFRVQGVQYNVAVFTNLTQDHLDFHKTIDSYRNAKLKLFRWLDQTGHAVINTDDPSAHYFRDATKAHVITYGIEHPADIMAKDIDIHIKGMTFTLVTPAGEIHVEPRLIGTFNIYNILAAVGVAISQGIDLPTIKHGLEHPIRVAGRFELVDQGQPFSVVVDYAHTPDGIINVLKLARALNPQRVISLFGCGGDRDKEKRPIMGKAVSEYSDIFIITSDNSRNEDPAEIAAQIKTGVTHSNFEEISDRREAIARSFEIAQPGDIVMLLGKGHETSQTLKKQTIHFNDVEVANELLAEYLKK
ncbi:UDP-N-acetylmuramoyl-L-alanyl-D-glutamate--2,6-diaminopimelate ligase [candidate division KSB1 bacterium]|nr:UDP-N-acetylmuramoyl-L-alanyl-D-glutamate--2,6-diaminopimelate ligase [candidate division KSB1 bacterium]